jgi:hypothetical protein
MGNKTIKNLAKRLIDISLGDSVEFHDSSEKQANELDMKFSDKPGDIPIPFYERVFNLVDYLVKSIMAFVCIIIPIVVCITYTILQVVKFTEIQNVSFFSILNLISIVSKFFGITMLISAGVGSILGIVLVILFMSRKFFSIFEAIYLEKNIKKNLDKTKNIMKELDEEEKRRRNKG